MGTLNIGTHTHMYTHIYIYVVIKDLPQPVLVRERVTPLHSQKPVSVYCCIQVQLPHSGVTISLVCSNLVE